MSRKSDYSSPLRKEDVEVLDGLLNWYQMLKLEGHQDLATKIYTVLETEINSIQTSEQING